MGLRWVASLLLAAGALASAGTALRMLKVSEISPGRSTPSLRHW